MAFKHDSKNDDLLSLEHPHEGPSDREKSRNFQPFAFCGLML
jgi:hypothetical protein